MSILNITGYKFINLSGLENLQEQLHACCNELSLKGTILLSAEGINLSLAGIPQAIATFRSVLVGKPSFHDMTFRESFSETQPFKRLKIKLKKEIITIRKDQQQPNENFRAATISPAKLKEWLDEDHQFTLLDTRNEYEIRFGTFKKAAHLNINQFHQFPEAAKGLSKSQPIVMFCTGGIRCEKAAISLIEQGHEEVYQLDGGILNYFIEVGADHYQGECYVFDERIAVDPGLKCNGTKQCIHCQGPIYQATVSDVNICSSCH